MTVENSPAFIQSNSYSAEITRRAIYALLQRGSSIGSVIGGLIHAADLEASYAGSGLKVSVATGEIIVPGSTSATQSGYYLRCSSAETLSPAAANSTNPRIERIVAQVKDAAYSGANNEGVIALVEGTATSGATLSNLSGVGAAPASSYTLGYVLIPAKATTITNEDIKNVAEPCLPAFPPANAQSYTTTEHSSAGTYEAEPSATRAAYVIFQLKASAVMTSLEVGGVQIITPGSNYPEDTAGASWLPVIMPPKTKWKVTTTTGGLGVATLLL